VFKAANKLVAVALVIVRAVPRVLSSSAGPAGAVERLNLAFLVAN